MELKFMLRKLLLGAALSLSLTAPALAQTAASWTWTGPYAGLNIGYGWGNETYNYQGSYDAPGAQPAYGSFDHVVRGVTGGAQIGYNYQMHDGLVLGVETDLDGTNTGFNRSYYGNDGAGNNYTGRIQSQLDYLGTVRGRVGLPIMGGRVMPYVTGGLAYGRVEGSSTFNCPGCAPGEGGSFNAANEQVGWTAGAGVEYPVSHRLSLKVEYLYADFGHGGLNTPNGGLGGPGVSIYNASANQQLDDNVVRVGLNYHF